jgi:hypothetical protein
VQVLKGARQTLIEQKVDAIVIEFMFLEIYEGQGLYLQICSDLHELGYTIFDIPHAVRHSDGQIRWGDAVFVSNDFRKKRL